MAQISQVAGNGSLMEDIGSQETVISSGTGSQGAAENGNAAAAMGISAGVSSDVVCGNPGFRQQLNSATVGQELEDDIDEDEDDDDVETFNLDDVIEAVASGTLGLICRNDCLSVCLFVSLPFFFLLFCFILKFGLRPSFRVCLSLSLFVLSLFLPPPPSPLLYNC